MTAGSALDQHAATYRQSAGELNRRLCALPALRWAERFLRPGPILHLGLGDGMVAQLLADRGDPLTVVEGSAALVAAADLPAHVTLVNSFFEDFTPARPFDQVIAIHVLEHVDDPVLVLARMRGWVNPGGRLLITVPNADSIHRRIGVALGMLSRTDELNDGDRALGHQRVYDAGAFHADLRAAGWHLERTGGFNVKVVSNAQMADWSDELLEATFEVSLRLPEEVCADLFAVCTP